MDPFDYSEKLRSTRKSRNYKNSISPQQATDERRQPVTKGQRQQVTDERRQPVTNSQRQQATDERRQPVTNSQRQPATKGQRQQVTDEQQSNEDKDKFDFRTIVNPPSPVPISDYQQPVPINPSILPSSNNVPPSTYPSSSQVNNTPPTNYQSSNVIESTDSNQSSAISMGEGSFCLNINQSPVLLKVLLFFRAIQEYFVVNRDFILTILLCLVLLWILNPFKRVYQCVNRLFGFGGDWCSEPNDKVEVVKKSSSTKSTKKKCSPKKQSNPVKSKPKSSCVAYVKKGAVFNAKTQLCNK